MIDQTNNPIDPNQQPSYQDAAAVDPNSIPADVPAENMVPVEIPIDQSQSGEILPPASDNSMMIVGSGEGNNIPKWFFAVFGITIVVFFITAILIIVSLMSKPKSSNTVVSQITQPVEPTISTIKPSITPQVTIANIVVVSPVVDAGVAKLRQKSSSDEIADIKTDLDNTDLTVIKDGLNNLDIVVASSN